MKKVYILQHLQDEGSIYKDIKQIGIYTSFQLAEEAKNRIKDKPGFIDFPNGFTIDEYIIDQDYFPDESND